MLQIQMVILLMKIQIYTDGELKTGEDDVGDSDVDEDVIDNLVDVYEDVHIVHIYKDGGLKTGVYTLLAIRGSAAGQTFKSELTKSEPTNKLGLKNNIKHEGYKGWRGRG